VVEAGVGALGCAKAQGWYYSKPLSVANVRRLLAERRLLRGAQAVEVPTPVTSQRLAG
jgi:hypothetical protein